MQALRGHPDVLLPANSPSSPRHSPSTHPLLRPRRSFQRLPFASKSNLLNPGSFSGGDEDNRLQSPLKLPEAGTAKRSGRGRGGGAMLFPASPDVETPAYTQENASTSTLSPSTASARSTRSSSRDGPGLKKKVVNAVGGMLGRTRSSTALRNAFHLGEWNQNLDAIAKQPSSSTPTSPGPQDDDIIAEEEEEDARNAQRRRSSIASDMSSPINEMSPRVSRPRPSYGRAGEVFSSRLELPTNESRRRKSDEMEEEQRDSFHQLQSPASALLPTRRDGHQPHHIHARSGSLMNAHAHTLRSSRTLSYHAGSADSPSAFSPAAIPRSSPSLNFENPFVAAASTSSTVPPPSKRLSIERLGSLAEDEDDLSDLSGDDAVFGGPSVPVAGPSAPRKVSRAKSLSRPTVPSFNIVPIPASSSHPGFETNKLSPALVTALPADAALRPPPSAARSRASTSGSGLDTLNETGPAIDYFSTSGSGLREGAPSPGLLSPATAAAATTSGEGAAMSTPRRRTSDGGAFSLLGAQQSSTLSAVDRASRRHSMLPQASGFSLSAMSPARPSTSVSASCLAKGKAKASTTGSTSMPDMSTTRGNSEMDTEEQAAKHFRVPRLRPLNPTTGPRRTSMIASTSTGELDGSPVNRRVASADGSRPFGTPLSNLGRKRNANGALLAGGVTSKLGAYSPIVNPPTSSPAQSRLRSEQANDEEEPMDEDDLPRRSMDSWREGAPTLTDGHSVSSCSLATALSGNLDDSAYTASTSTHSLNSTHGNLPEGMQPDGTFFTPQNYKSVRPNAAIFMSTGLISKRNRPRSGSFSGAPVFNIHQHLQQQLGETGAVKASPLKHVVLAPAEASTATLPNPLVMSLSRPPSVMPDTPVKRSSFIHPTASTLSADTLLPISTSVPSLVQGSPEDSQSSPSTTAMDTGSPIGASGALSSKQVTTLSLTRTGTDSTESLSPVASTSRPFHRSPLSGRSPPSNDSPPDGTDEGASRRSGVESGDLSPSAHASRSTTRPPGSGRSSSRPLMFRRRSSGQMRGESGPFNPHGSGSSSSGSVTGATGEAEPMTPTRSVGGRYWEGTQLFDTPTEGVQDLPITPATPGFPILPGPSFAASTQSTIFLQPLATPLHGVPRASFPLSHDEQRQHLPALHERTEPDEQGRPQFKVRHSSSAIHSIQQLEKSQPSWLDRHYHLISQLGEGAFSDAWRVQERQEPGQVYAVKRTKTPFIGPKDRLRRLEEVDILRLFSTAENRSPHLISLVDAWEQSGHLFILTELCPNGNLQYWLDEYGDAHEQLDEARVWKILAELTAGVSHLHSRGVLHLDLKPANVFITDKGHLKLGDFGLATRWPRTDAVSIMKGAAVQSPGIEGLRNDNIWKTQEGERRIRAKSNGDQPEDLEREGDREYIAPEILGGRYGKEADVFSLGLIILEGAANVVLPENGQPWQKLRQNDFTDVDLSRFSAPLHRVLEGMLRQSPDIRSTITDVAAHPIVAQLIGMLHRTLSSTALDPSATPEILGATYAEADSFLQDVFSQAYPALSSPAAPAFTHLPLEMQEPPTLDVDAASQHHEQKLAGAIEEDGERMEID